MPNDKSNWVPDSEVSSCQNCEKSFGLTNRKHHCRQCGGVFCAKCSGNKTVLEGGPGHAQRVCTSCFNEQLKKDSVTWEEEEKKKQMLESKKQAQKRADDEYVTTIYDKEGLVQEIIHYLQGGCQVGVVCDTERTSEKAWLQANPSCVCREAPGSVPDGFPLDSLSRVRLGKSKEFKHVPISKAEQTQCLTMDFSTPSKRGKTSFSIVCTELVDFEAWVLGVCHVKNLVPVWDEQTKYDKNFSRSLTPGQLAKLTENNIPQALFKKVRDEVVERQNRIKHELWVHDNDERKAWIALNKTMRPILNHDGACFMTKGELRHMSGLDIFRACALWEVLASLTLIFDPQYRPAVGKGSTDPVRRKPINMTSTAERRIDTTDGHAYTKEEFLDHYKGTTEWDKSQKVIPKPREEPKPVPKVAEEAKEDEEDEKPEEAPVEEVKPKKEKKEKKEKRSKEEEVVQEEAQEPEVSEADAKAERKRLRRVLAALIASSVAISTQSAYEAKKLAKRAARKKAKEEAAEQAAAAGG